MSRKAKAIVAVVVVLALAGAVTAYAVSASNVTLVRVAEVTAEDLAVTVAASGKVEASSRTDVYPPTAGTLATLEVEDGDEVTAGQVLAVMDTAPIEIQVAQAKAAHKGAVAQRNAIIASAPGSADLAAAQAAVDAAYGAYQAAEAGYQAALGGAGGPTSADVAEARVIVAIATAARDAAQAAYDAFHTNIYLPAPEPPDPGLESALEAFTLTRDLAIAELATAEAALAALEGPAGAMATAQAKMARDQAYAAYLGAVSQRDALAKASNVRAALASADAAVAAAEAALEFANDTLDGAEIVAPADGVVLFGGASAASLLGGGSLGGLGGSSGGTEAGLAVGSSVSPAAAVFTIVTLEDLAFTALVDETDVAKVEPGMAATISLDGFADEMFEATVDRIGKESTITSTGGTAFPVRLLFGSKGKQVLLGMNGSAEIEVETIGSTITMPVEALLEDGDASYAFVVERGRAHRVEIEAGRMTDTRVEVLSGLADGDTVIVSGVAELEDGDRVREE